MTSITISQIAGYTTENIVWNMLLQLSEYGKKENLQEVLAEDIIVEESKFEIRHFSQKSHEPTCPFAAPETFQATAQSLTPKSNVWTLGALAFYAMTGKPIFEGKGGSTQLPETIIPKISSACASDKLSELIRQCLSYSPAERPTIDEIINTSKAAINTPRTPRPRLVSQSGRQYATSLVKFWPEEMVPLIIISMWALLSLPLFAQDRSFNRTTIPNEMAKLVMYCADLRNTANTAKVKKALAKDLNWTMMDELTIDKKGECTTKDPVDMFGINDIGFSILKRNGGVVNAGGRFRDGRDPRYKYSFIEVTVKKGSTVNYTLDHREGMQVFAVVPFDKTTSFTASILHTESITQEETFTEDGVCYIQLKKGLKKGLKPTDKFNLSIQNKSKKNAAFVIINYNSRNHE